MAGFEQPEWEDFDPRKPVVAVKLRKLGTQYDQVAADATDTNTPVGFAVASVASAIAGIIRIRDNLDGTLTITTDESYIDNGDGTLTIGT